MRRCNTYYVMPNEPHLGRVRECTDTVDGELIQDAIAELAEGYGYLHPDFHFDAGGYEWQVKEFLDAGAIDMINEKLEYDENADARKGSQRDHRERAEAH